MVSGYKIVRNKFVNVDKGLQTVYVPENILRPSGLLCRYWSEDH